MSAALTTIDGEATEIVTRSYAPPFNKEYAEMALQALRDGITMREHCRMQKAINPDYPSPSTIYDWYIADSCGFSTQYAHARRAQCQRWAEEILEIAEDGRNDWMERRRLDGTIVRTVDTECVQRSKLRCDTRKWLLSKLSPEFADRVQHQQLGANGLPVDPPSAVQPIDLSIALRGWKPKDDRLS